MKYIGFIKEEDKNIGSAKYFNEMFLTKDFTSTINNSIVAYLKNGHFLAGTMSFIFDNEGKAIGPLEYFTDGQFVWPVYYPYYLQKYKNFLIDEDLLHHCHSNNFEIEQLSEERLKKIDSDFLEEWSKKN